MVVASRRPSWSRAAATWVSLWVSTPTVTCGGAVCAMVVLAILSTRRAGGRTGRAGGQHCDESGGNRLLSGHAPPVGAAWWRPRRRADRSDGRHQAGGRRGQTHAATAPACRAAPAWDRRIVQRAPGRWEPGSGPSPRPHDQQHGAAARVDGSGTGHAAGGIKGQALTTTTTEIIAVVVGDQGPG